MENKDYLISLARKFASEHKAVNKVYDTYINDKDLLCFDIDIKINLPSSFKKKGQTTKGVRNIEKLENDCILYVIHTDPDGIGFFGDPVYKWSTVGGMGNY